MYLFVTRPYNLLNLQHWSFNLSAENCLAFLNHDMKYGAYMLRSKWEMTCKFLHSVCILSFINCRYCYLIKFAIFLRQHPGSITKPIIRWKLFINWDTTAQLHMTKTTMDELSKNMLQKIDCEVLLAICWVMFLPVHLFENQCQMSSL